MSQQALSEARAKIKVSAFIALFKGVVDIMMTHRRKKWNGYLVYAIDGSKIALPADNGLLKHFGGLGPTKKSPTAQGSVLYDVLNDIVVDAAIEPLTTDERTLALRHIEALQGAKIQDRKMVLHDRGYASFEVIQKLEKSGALLPYARKI